MLDRDAPMDATTDFLPRAPTDISGLDFALGGGLAPNRLHLLEGSHGTGTTTVVLRARRETSLTFAKSAAVSLAYPSREGADQRQCCLPEMS